jgi:hypothetical protein
MSNNHTEYGEHHFICFQNAGGWWGEIYRQGSLVGVTTAKGYGRATTMDECEGWCRDIIDSMNGKPRDEEARTAAEWVACIN